MGCRAAPKLCPVLQGSCDRSQKVPRISAHLYNAAQGNDSEADLRSSKKSRNSCFNADMAVKAYRREKRCSYKGFSNNILQSTQMSCLIRLLLQATGLGLPLQVLQASTPLPFLHHFCTGTLTEKAEQHLEVECQHCRRLSRI